MIQLQNKSCCFCESRVTHISFGDVEHYRPKAGYFQDEGDLFHKPGYFWLAYEWSNLLFCCKICNRRYKQNFFPLKDPAKRCKFNKSFSVKSEAPLFINPFETDPAEHITFNKEIPVGKTEEGRVTISKLGLLREELNEMRRDTLSSLLALKQCWEINQGTAAESQIKRLFLDNLKEKIADCG